MATVLTLLRGSGTAHDRRLSGWVLLVSVWLGAAAVAGGQTPSQPDGTSQLPTITYRRVFEGSTPEFVEIVVRQDGTAKADVRQLSEDPSPEEFVVGMGTLGQIFDLAGRLHNFQGADLEMRRRVAYMGRKTFRWDKGAESYQAEYNYTADPTASQLQKVFDNLVQEQTDLATLEHRLRYDRLGVSQALDQFEGHLSQGVLPQPERFLTVLDRIAEDARLIERARQRARSLAARIRVAQQR